MKIYNNTGTSRAVCIGDSYYLIEPMSDVEIPEDSSNKALLANLQESETMKKMIALGIFSFGQGVRKSPAPVEVKGPVPPIDLILPPDNDRVTPEKPRKIKEVINV